MEKAIYAGQVYNSTSSAFHERVLGLSFSETCVLLLEITLRKQEWRIVKRLLSTSMAQLWFGLVFRYELLSVSFLATDFSPGCTTHFFLPARAIS